MSMAHGSSLYNNLGVLLSNDDWLTTPQLEALYAFYSSLQTTCTTYVSKPWGHAAALLVTVFSDTTVLHCDLVAAPVHDLLSSPSKPETS
jgi:hypothetical protein